MEVIPREKIVSPWKQALSLLNIANPEHRATLEEGLEEMTEEKAMEVVQWLKTIPNDEISHNKDISIYRVSAAKERTGEISWAHVREREFEQNTEVNGVRILCQSGQTSGYGYTISFPQLNQKGGSASYVDHLQRGEAVIGFNRACELAQQMGDATQVLTQLAKELNRTARI
ncbi:hypothetical protein KBD61_05360 [Patescibacteria group bacterium]|nr:hypothetical protein [Patescibacteria group bacterium]MBP9710418.1 hypothetical protein [Patescibacteria group bacterium]